MSDLREALFDPRAGAVALRLRPGRKAPKSGRASRLRRLRREGARIAVETSDGALRPDGARDERGSGRARTQDRLQVSSGRPERDHPDLESADGDPRIPTWLQESWAIATPLPGRLRLAGTLELAGLDLTIDTVRAQAVRRGGERGLRGLEGRRVVDVWAGLRPCTPDGLPCHRQPLGPARSHLRHGTRDEGRALAPVTAQLVGGLVAGEPPSHDLSPFDPDRFRPLLPLGS